MPEDTRFVYGANCTWFGSITEVSNTATHPAHAELNNAIAESKLSGDHGLPCCPKCGGMLMEYENSDPWWDGVDGFERGDYPRPRYTMAIEPQPEWIPRPHPGYRAMIEWGKAQPRCFRHPMHLKNAYHKYTGILVDITP